MRCFTFLFQCIQQSCVLPEGDSASAVQACVQEGMIFKGKYTMQSHGWPGPAYVLCSANRTADRGQHLSVKLFARGVDYLQEKALLETPTITLQEFLPGQSCHQSTYIDCHGKSVPSLFAACLWEA